MLSRKDEFKKFVRFNNLHNFTKTHADLCGGKFEDVWSNECITKKRCSECGSVAFLSQVSAKPILTDAPKNRPKQIPTMSTIQTLEGYIRREKLGLEPVDYKQDRHEYKFMNHCVSCGQWFKAHAEKDVCPDCSNISSGESGLDYDKFYKDSIEFWQGGQKHEVGSAGGRPAKPKPATYIPSNTIVQNWVRMWDAWGLSAREIRLQLAQLTSVPASTKFAALAAANLA